MIPIQHVDWVKVFSSGKNDLERLELAFEAMVGKNKLTVPKRQILANKSDLVLTSNEMLDKGELTYEDFQIHPDEQDLHDLRELAHHQFCKKVLQKHCIPFLEFEFVYSKKKLAASFAKILFAHTGKQTDEEDIDALVSNKNESDGFNIPGVNTQLGSSNFVFLKKGEDPRMLAFYRAVRAVPEILVPTILVNWNKLTYTRCAISLARLAPHRRKQGASPCLNLKNLHSFKNAES